MADLMRHHIGDGEAAHLHAELPLHIVEEAEIEIDLLVERAIEGAGGALAGAAGRRCLALL